MVSHSEIYFHGGFSTSFCMLTGVHPQFLRVPPQFFFPCLSHPPFTWNNPILCAFIPYFLSWFLAVVCKIRQLWTGERIHLNASKAIMHHQYFDGFNLWFYSPKYHLCLYEYQQCGYLISISSSIIIWLLTYSSDN